MPRGRHWPGSSAPSRTAGERRHRAAKVASAASTRVVVTDPAMGEAGPARSAVHRYSQALVGQSQTGMQNGERIT